MSGSKPETKLPISLTLRDTDAIAVLTLLADQLTMLAGNMTILRDIECEVMVDTDRGRASLRFRAC